MKKKTTRQQQRTRQPGRRPDGWFPVDKGTPLQVLLKTRMTAIGAALGGGDGPELSTHEVAARSKGLVSANTVSAILRGKVDKPTEQTIRALALALEVGEDDVRRAAASGSQVTLQLPAKAAKLGPEAWRELLNYLDYLLERQ